MMKVLLAVSSYDAAFPYIQDIRRELSARGVHVTILEVQGNPRVFESDGSIKHILPPTLLRPLLKIPKLRTWVRIFILKGWLKKMRSKADAVGIHSCDLVYTQLMPDLNGVSSNLSATIWGSDFYRATTEQREQKRAIFKDSRFVVFGNPVNAKDFLDYYKDFERKAVIGGFGITKFEIIRKLSIRYTSIENKRHFRFPVDKIILAVGYNGVAGQQHEKLLEELRGLPAATKKKLFLVLQMTYGFDEAYCKGVERVIEEIGIDFQIFRTFLDDEETSRLRLAIDVVLNAQITDGFSASIQEHIFAGNILVVGNWLPYRPMELAGIFYLKKPLGEFGQAVQEVVNNFEEIKSNTTSNTEKIYAISSWDRRIKNWLAIYEGRGDVVRYDETVMHIN